MILLEGLITINRKQQQSEQTKKKVADAARTLFATKGYKGTSIEELVTATGASKGNIYYHFKSKEGLFLYLIEEWDTEWEQKWQENAAHHHTAVDKMYAIAELLVLDDFNHPLTKAADEFFNLEQKTSEVEARIIKLVNRHVEFNERLIQEGIDRGEFKAGDVQHLAVIMESLLFGLNYMAKRAGSIEEMLVLYRTAMQVLLHGLVKQIN
jgi:AcrR family transcriptional regulator